MQHFPVDFGNAAHTMLLVDSRIFKLGKDVLFDLLSYCGWGWFEVSAEEEDKGGAGPRASKRSKRLK